MTLENFKVVCQFTANMPDSKEPSSAAAYGLVFSTYWPIVRIQGTALLDTGKLPLHAFGSGPQIIICVTEEKSQYYSMTKTEIHQIAERGVTTQCMIYDPTVHHKGSVAYGIWS
ncbi:hypothetical protein DFH28DRAFT_924952 [Melampsora americana]|nr:hypothetical protein DFH28DRAFT_924952 [Melampsora americana]